MTAEWLVNTVKSVTLTSLVSLMSAVTAIANSLTYAMRTHCSSQKRGKILLFSTFCVY